MVSKTEVNEDSPEAGGSKKEAASASVPKKTEDTLAEGFKMLAKILENQNKNQGSGQEGQKELLETVISEIRKKSDEEKFGDRTKFTSIEDIDPADHIESGIAFYCHQGGYVITSDKKQGKQIKTPFNSVIIFEYQHSSVKGSGRDITIQPLSQYVCFSKKEKEWLENSSFFGWKIFNDFNKPVSQSALEAVKLADYYMKSKGMETGEIMKACKEYGIPNDKDVEKMRLALANHFAKEEIRMEKENDRNRAVEAKKTERALL